MSRTLVLGDPLVVLGDASPGYIRDGALVIEGRRIVRVGRRQELERLGPFDRQIGSPGHAVLPGFINGHYHSGSVLSRGMPQYIFERANVHVHAMWNPVTEEDLYHAVLGNVMNDVKGGQTGFVDLNYGRSGLANFGYDAILQAYQDLGVRVALGVVTRDRNTLVHADDEAFLAMLPSDLAERVRASSMGYAWPVEEVFALYRDLVTRWDKRDGRIRVLLAPDWTPACSDELYVRNRQIADEFGTGIMTHMLETRSEMMYALDSDGKTAMRRLADLGVLGPDVSCSHFVWATDEDISILADTGAVAVNNPGSNLRLSTGIARVRDIMDRGGPGVFRHRQHLVLGLRRLLPGTPSRGVPAEDTRAAGGRTHGLGNPPESRCTERRPSDTVRIRTGLPRSGQGGRPGRVEPRPSVLAGGALRHHASARRDPGSCLFRRRGGGHGGRGVGTRRRGSSPGFPRPGCGSISPMRHCVSWAMTPIPNRYAWAGRSTPTSSTSTARGHGRRSNPPRCTTSSTRPDRGTYERGVTVALVVDCHMHIMEPDWNPMNVSSGMAESWARQVRWYEPPKSDPEYFAEAWRCPATAAVIRRWRVWTRPGWTRR